jgi:hypothetical protein
MSSPEEVITIWKNKNNSKKLLDISNWDITELPEIPDEVERLDINNTNITVITYLPAKLLWFNCQSTPLESLPTILPPNLKYIDCRNCNKLKLFKLPFYIKIRENFNQIIREEYNKNTPPSILLQERIYEVYNTNKRTLDISNLGLEALPKLPNNLKRLNCNNNPIKLLNNLPNSLKKLKCEGTLIKNFINMPSCLFNLNCSRTSINSIDNLPDKLKILIADNCDNLEIINFLPSGLEFLSLECSPIKSIKYFPVNLITVDLTETNIEYVPTLPDTLREFYYRITYKLKGFTNIPRSLKILHIGECDNVLLPQLPDGLLKLIIPSLNMLNGYILPNSIEYLESREIYLSV